MSSISSLLPKPKNRDDKHVKEPSSSSSTDLVAPSDIPPYGQRVGWKPKSQQDFGDGGAYPECHIAQYPLKMGKDKKKKSKTLDVTYDSKGNVDYSVIATRGHDKESNVKASYNDLVPLRQRQGSGQISLAKPDDKEIEETTNKTKEALDKILNNQLEKVRPSAIAKKPGEATYVRYTPANQMGTQSSQQRIIRVQDYEQDPLAPSRFKQSNVPDRPQSPPPPVLHSPPRKATQQEREDWYIPPAVSNWKNPRGFAVALDKRVAADGRSLHDNTINDNKAKLAEALYSAEVTGRKYIRERAAMEQKLAEKANEEKEEQLREMARQAREMHKQSRPERAASPEEEEERQPEDRGEDDEREREEYRASDHSSDDDETEESRKRAEARKERRREREKELRMARMGTEQRARILAKDSDRDISEKVALGLAKPTALSGDSRFDSRLFNHGSTPAMSEDQVYDKALFAEREALASIYKTRGSGVTEKSEEGRITGEGRFDVLGAAKKGFKGADEVEPSEGPVEFVKDTSARANDGDDEEPSRKRQKH